MTVYARHQLSGVPARYYADRFEVALIAAKQLLEHLGYYVGPDATGMAYVVVSEEGEGIGGPTSCMEGAVFGAVTKLTNAEAK